MPTSKSTFSLGAESIKNINRLARSWRASKTEVVRRALQQAAERNATPSVEEKLAALKALQKSMRERGVDFDAWQKAICDGRR